MVYGVFLIVPLKWIRKRMPFKKQYEWNDVGNQICITTTVNKKDVIVCDFSFLIQLNILYRIAPLYHPINMPFTNHLRMNMLDGVWMMEYISLVQCQNGLLTSSVDVCIIQFSSCLSITLPMAPYCYGFTWLVIVVLVDSRFIVRFSWVINWVISCLKVVPSSWYIAPYLIWSKHDEFEKFVNPKNVY